MHTYIIHTYIHTYVCIYISIYVYNTYVSSYILNIFAFLKSSFSWASYCNFKILQKSSSNRISPNNIFWRSWSFDNILLILKSDAKCLEMINFTSSFRAKKFMINDVLKYSNSTAIQYRYIIYKRQVFKPFSKWFFF